jgi:hypothetical protein
MTRSKVQTEYPQFWGDLLLSLSGGFSLVRVKWYTFSCVMGKKHNDCGEMLGITLANSVVKTTWYLEFLQTSTRVSYEDSWRLARNCIFSVVSCKWDIILTLRPPLHHMVTTYAVCPTGSLRATCQWRLPGPHPRIELKSVRRHLYAPPSYTPQGYNRYCMSHRIFTDMSVKTSRAPPRESNSCQWGVTFMLRPPLHHTVTTDTVCPTGSLQTCQWRLTGPHQRIELMSVRCYLYTLSSFTPHGYNRYCMSYRIFTDMSVETSKAPAENRTHVSTLRFSRLYLLENKIFMFCGISGSWGSDLLVSELLYKKQNLIGVLWLKAGHTKLLLTIHSEFASWVWGWKKRVYVKIDSELLGERRREITGGLASSSFSIMYFFFFRNLASPKGSACENESVFGEVTNLKLAVSKPDYCDDNFFFSWRFKEMIRVLLPAYFFQPVKIV